MVLSSMYVRKLICSSKQLKIKGLVTVKCHCCWAIWKHLKEINLNCAKKKTLGARKWSRVKPLYQKANILLVAMYKRNRIKCSDLYAFHTDKKSKSIMAVGLVRIFHSISHAMIRPGEETWRWNLIYMGLLSASATVCTVWERDKPSSAGDVDVSPLITRLREWWERATQWISYWSFAPMASVIFNKPPFLPNPCSQTIATVLLIHRLGLGLVQAKCRSHLFLKCHL